MLGLYKHEDGTMWAHVDNFGPWKVFVSALDLKGPRIHITHDFFKYYSPMELH